MYETVQSSHLHVFGDKRNFGTICLALVNERIRNVEMNHTYVHGPNIYACVCEYVFVEFSIILPLIEMICAKGMRASQPQCQIENERSMQCIVCIQFSYVYLYWSI